MRLIDADALLSKLSYQYGDDARIAIANGRLWCTVADFIQSAEEVDLLKLIDYVADKTKHELMWLYDER